VIQSDPFSGPGLMEAGILPAKSPSRRSRPAFGEIIAHRFADKVLLNGR
jgi:hypothetical protein